MNFNPSRLIWKRLNVDGFVFQHIGKKELTALLSPKKIIFLDFSFKEYPDLIALFYAFKMLIRLRFAPSIINQRFVNEVKLAKFNPRKIWRLFKLSYAIGFIERHRFSFGVTFADDAPLFHLISMYFEGKLKIIALQNGNRYYPMVFSNLETRNGWFGGCSCFLQTLVSLSEYENQVYSQEKFYAKRIVPLGSLRLSYWKDSHEHLLSHSITANIFDICVITTADFEFDSYYYLAQYISTLSSRTKLKICISLNFPLTSNDDAKKLAKYKKYFGDRVQYSSIDERRAYELSLVSHLTIGVFSTVLREALDLGCKVYPLNFDGPQFSGPYEKFNETGLTLNPTFDEFVAKTNELISMSSAEYVDKFKEVIDLISAKSEWVFYRKEVQKLLFCD